MNTSYPIEIKELISRFAEDIKASNKFFVDAKAGNISKEQVGLYLHNIYIILTKTGNHLKLAIQSAEKKGNQPLADFMRSKLPIETGNEEWIAEDLGRLELEQAQIDKFYVTPNMVKIINFIEGLATNDPESYLGYEFYTASLALEIGPVLRNYLFKCGISMEQMDTLKKYQRVDSDFSINDIQSILGLIPAESFERVVKNILASDKIFKDFLTDIANGTVEQDQ
jgi:hypothetical protein